MSDRNNNTHNNGDAKELFDLLDRLERRDEVRRYQRNLRPFAEYEQPELITVEAPNPRSAEEDMPLRIDRFQPIAMSEEDLQELLITDEDAHPDGAVAAAPKVRRNPFKVLWEGFVGNIPRKEDSRGTKARKCGFLFSLLVMLVALIYLAVDLLILPAQRARLKDELIGLYHPDQSHTVVSSRDGDYPKNMLASFRELYDLNSEVRGFITYHASGKTDFLNIEYPIVYRDVEDTENPYLHTNFKGEYDRAGTLFFDQSNQLNSYRDQNRSLGVYGHNMKGGEMFAGLNKFLNGVNYVRSAPTFTLSTLYRNDDYKVFAVVLLDESDEVKARKFNVWNTQFATDAAFLGYIDEARARSMYDFPVDVTADDQIVVLSTCTGKTSAHVKDGRLVVLARRVRDGESVTVNTKEIQKNSDVIMPYYWYINQNKTPHKYYSDAGVDYPATPNLPTSSTTTTTTTTTTGSGGTDTTTGEGTTTSGTGTTTGTKAPTTTTTKADGGDDTGSDDVTTTTKAEDTTTTTAGGEGEHTHTYDNACDATCNECGAEREVGDHDCEETVLVAPSCGEDGYGQKKCVCKHCGYEYTDFIDPIDHAYGEDGNCTMCGAAKPADPTDPPSTEE